MRLRKAAEDGQSAALITPDRMLTRQVTAALDTTLRQLTADAMNGQMRLGIPDDHTHDTLAPIIAGHVLASLVGFEEVAPSYRH